MDLLTDTDLRRAFDLALDAQPTDRSAVLERDFPGDLQLHRRVLAMITAAEDDSFLSGSTRLWPTISRPPEIGPDLAGSQIGPYRLIEKIGEGGFGTVYRAGQSLPVTRQVAIKILHLGMNTRQVLARFEQERQALAILDHPNIARVIDAGATVGGRPFVVMDLVNGESIVRFCDANRLGIDARLRLFSQVCSAIQHAHTKGVIHRDIKPSNVLVTPGDDGATVVKVIDFGIAKATSGRLIDETFVTEQRQFLGTPEYMSPEQAAGATDIDTRADVYSLGAMLYELLTGNTPFPAKELRSAGPAELRRVLRENDPPKPSTRLSRTEPADATTAATARRMSPQRLSVVVRGELDWITMKALEKDRDRRYATVNGLLADVTRYLDGDPVQAAPPSRIYLVRKTIRRHRAAAFSTIAVAFSLAIGATAFAWQAHRVQLQRDQAITARNAERTALDAAVTARDAERTARDAAVTAGAAERKARDTAIANARMAERVNAFFSDYVLAFGDEDHPADAQKKTLLEAITAASTEVDHEFPKDPLIRAAIRQALGASFRQMGLWNQAVVQFNDCYSIRLKALGDGDPLTFQAGRNLAEAYKVSGQPDKAETVLAEILDAHRRVDGQDSLPTYEAMADLAFAYTYHHRFKPALPLLKSSYEGQLKLHADRTEKFETTVSVLTLAYHQTGKVNEATKLAQWDVDHLHSTIGDDHAETAHAMYVLAVYLAKGGKFDKAIPMIRRADDIDRRVLGEDDPDRLEIDLTLASMLAATNDVAGADRICTDAVRIARGSNRIRRARLGELIALNARVLFNTGEYGTSEAGFLEAHGIMSETYGPHAPETMLVVSDLVNLYNAQNRSTDAAKWQAKLPTDTAPTGN